MYLIQLSSFKEEMSFCGNCPFQHHAYKKEEHIPPVDNLTSKAKILSLG